MNVVQLNALLEKKTFSSADKTKINKAYQTAFGRRPATATSCNDCYHDAVKELVISLSKGERLLAGVVIEYKGRFYNRHDYPLPAEILRLHADKLEK